MKKTINISERFELGLSNPKMLADVLYYEQFGKNINWSNPKDLNEIINWLAFHSDTTIWTRLSDKYLVRDYIESKGFGHILTKLYGVWDNPEKIDFTNLPYRFMLKCNHDSGSVFPVEAKRACNINQIKSFFRDKMSIPFGVLSAEPHYLKIKRLVIAEEYLENDSGFSDSLVDYKFYSFHGNCEYCLICYDTKNWQNKKSGIYNIKTWKLLKEKMQNKNRFPTIDIPKPHCLNEMLEITYCLSQDFPQCRVDLYESDKKVYFGELTFTSGCGRIKNFTSEFLMELGNKIQLPK